MVVQACDSHAESADTGRPLEMAGLPAQPNFRSQVPLSDPQKNKVNSFQGLTPKDFGLHIHVYKYMYMHTHTCTRIQTYMNMSVQNIDTKFQRLLKLYGLLCIDYRQQIIMPVYIKDVYISGFAIFEGPRTNIQRLPKDS